jgi:hypothetical protein
MGLFFYAIIAETLSYYIQADVATLGQSPPVSRPISPFILMEREDV